MFLFELGYFFIYQLGIVCRVEMLVIEVRVKLFVAGVKRAKGERGIRGIRGFHPFPCNLVEVLQLFRVCIRTHELTRSGSVL